VPPAHSDPEIVRQLEEAEAREAELQKQLLAMGRRQQESVAPRPMVEPASEPEPRARRTGPDVKFWTALLTALAGLGLSGQATFRLDRAPPERVNTTREWVAAVERDGKEKAAEIATLKDYVRRRDEADECRDRHLRAAFQRQGIDLPGLPSGGVKWLTEALPAPDKRKPPTFFPAESCPPRPKPP
jgi:hypothetical protein